MMRTVLVRYNKRYPTQYNEVGYFLFSSFLDNDSNIPSCIFLPSKSSSLGNSNASAISHISHSLMQSLSLTISKKRCMDSLFDKLYFFAIVSKQPLTNKYAEI